MPDRPRRLVLVAGTATEVGKTWMSAAVAADLRARGLRVAARKPAQSFAPGDPSPTDADVLAAATGDEPHAVCPAHRWYPLAYAPPMAADALGRPRIALDDLVAELAWPPSVDVGLVETAGGVRSPIAHDGDAVDLAGRLQPQVVVLVADAALGVLSHVRLAVGALGGYRVVVALNRYDATADLHARNARWLGTVDGLEVVTSARALADLLAHG